MIQYVSLTNMHQKLSYTGINTCIIAFTFSKDKKNKEILIISEALFYYFLTLAVR